MTGWVAADGNTYDTYDYPEPPVNPADLIDCDGCQ